MQNLGAEFDNDQSPAESAGCTQNHRVSRRPTEQAILSSLRDWLLHDYIVPYARSLAATLISRRCYWIEGLGGSLDLQPVVLIAQALAKESKPMTLRAIVLEARSGKRKNASSENSIAMPKESGTVRASWPEAAPTILQAIDQSAAVFLLNPFAGSTPFSYEDLAPLYQRTAPSELCLLISPKQVELALLPYLHSGAGASPFTALLRSDHWKALLTKDAGIDRIGDGLVDTFLASMQQHFLSVQRIPLSVQAGPPLVTSVPLSFIFFSPPQDKLASID